MTTIGGTKTSVEKLAKQKENDLDQFSVTIIPGTTTAKVLGAQLACLGIKSVTIEALEKIAGVDKVFDKNEIIPLDDYLDKEFALWGMQKSGIVIDDWIKENLITDKAKDPDYIGALIELQKSGIKVNGLLIDSLSLDKGQDKDYISALIEIKKGGVEISASMVIHLARETAKDPGYRHLLIEDKGDFNRADMDYIKKYFMEHAKGKKEEEINSEVNNLDSLTRLYMDNYNTALGQIVLQRITHISQSDKK